jgi:biopolymer transport protein ExbD
MKTREPEAAVVVKGAEDADYQHIVGVLDVIQQLDITRVGLATEAAP